jgi:hypothetical protein
METNENEDTGMLRPYFEGTMEDIDEGSAGVHFRAAACAVCETHVANLAAENAVPDPPGDRTLRDLAVIEAHKDAEDSAWEMLRAAVNLHAAQQVIKALKGLA